MDYKAIQKELDNTARPLFFFHDDADGMCSFLQFRSYVGEGYGVIVKSRPLIDMKFLTKVEALQPDKIFVLDIAMMEQEFVDRASTKIIWLDHHPPQEIHAVDYYNPRLEKADDNTCIADITYRIVKKNLWWAVVGSVGDMQWPKDLIKKFRKKYPELLPPGVNDPRTATYSTDLGKLIRIFSFIIKGTSRDALKHIKLLQKIKEPSEILNQENDEGRRLFKRFQQINREYQKLIRDAKKCASDDPILLYTYHDSSMAFSGDLANELAFRFPDKIILAAREKNGEYKCSFRSEKHNLPPMINKALEGLQGYGGGHEHAAGGCIKSEDFEKFVENLRKLS